jgi:hypothetical protein
MNWPFGRKPNPRAVPNDSTTAANEAIIAQVEQLGGGVVWEPEVFAVTLMDVSVSDEQALVLCGLEGVEQIAIDASQLQFSTIKALAEIPGLASLVLGECRLLPEQVATLRQIVPEVEVV